VGVQGASGGETTSTDSEATVLRKASANGFESMKGRYIKVEGDSKDPKKLVGAFPNNAVKSDDRASDQERLGGGRDGQCNWIKSTRCVGTSLPKRTFERNAQCPFWSGAVEGDRGGAEKKQECYSWGVKTS